MAEQTARRKSFLIRVLDGQNATWQGVVSWSDGKQERPFRSALELLKLMDNVLGSKQA